jgi:hypothetical protein
MPSPNSFTVFRDLVSTGSFEPSRGNLFSVEMGVPTILFTQSNVDLGPQDYYNAVNYFADSVSLPSRNITTGEHKTVGIKRAYATGQTANELTVSFLMTKNNWHRNLFERWMHAIAPDNENRVAFYDDYVTDITVRKWESGSNIKARATTSDGDRRETRLNKATGVYRFVGAFPYNIAGLTYSNDAQLMKMDVIFKYERYRFSTKVKTTGEWTNEVVMNDFDLVSTLFRRNGINTQFGI